MKLLMRRPVRSVEMTSLNVPRGTDAGLAEYAAVSARICA
jgi:hypothetical protein